MLRAIWEEHGLFQKEASAWLVDECLLSPYPVPAKDFGVNHTDKVLGADILGKGQWSEMWDEVPFSTELPNMGYVQVSLYEQGFKDVMERSSALLGDWSIWKLMDSYFHAVLAFIWLNSLFMTQNVCVKSIFYGFSLQEVTLIFLISLWFSPYIYQTGH